MTTGNVGNSLAFGKLRSDCANVVLCYLSLMILTAVLDKTWVYRPSFTGTSSAFAGGIGHVVGLCSDEQMSRVATRRIVATVQDADVIGERTVGEKPTDAMGEKVRLATGDLVGAVSLIGHTVSRPQPARPKIGLMCRDGAMPINLCPKVRNLFVGEDG